MAVFKQTGSLSPHETKTLISHVFVALLVLRSIKPCLGPFCRLRTSCHPFIIFPFPTYGLLVPSTLLHGPFIFLLSIDRRFLVRISHNKLTVIINPTNQKLVWTTIVVFLVTCSIYVSRLFPITFTLIPPIVHGLLLNIHVWVKLMKCYMGPK